MRSKNRASKTHARPAMPMGNQSCLFVASMVTMLLMVWLMPSTCRRSAPVRPGTQRVGSRAEFDCDEILERLDGFAGQLAR